MMKEKAQKRGKGILICPLVTWASELNGQGLGPDGPGGPIAKFNAMAIFWPIPPF